jgi:hypothetical protein
MSGGRFNYDQRRIGYIAEAIIDEINKSGRKKTRQELNSEYWSGDKQDPFHYKYPDEVIEEFKKGVELLKLAQIYAHRIDWLISGDDGNESFLKRLKEELKQTI